MTELTIGHGSHLIISPGTVSILASRHVRGAVGVEAVHNAVRDARNNALANGVCNVEFIAGLAEKVSRFSSQEIDCYLIYPETHNLFNGSLHNFFYKYAFSPSCKQKCCVYTKNLFEQLKHFTFFRHKDQNLHACSCCNIFSYQ